jgi:hypothetical protein
MVQYGGKGVRGALMNRLVMKELTDEHVVYFYYPDGIGPCGEIEYIFGEEEAKVLKFGNGDRGCFANMALDFLDDCIDADMFPFRWTVAWN